MKTVGQHALRRHAAALAMSAAVFSAHAQTAAPEISLKAAFQNDFRIGAAINKAHFEGKDARGAAIVAAQFNTITPENALKWGQIHPAPDRYDFKAADAYVAFGEQHRMWIVGHCLVWHNQAPKWIFEDAHGAPVTREVLLARLREHIMTVVGRYKGRIAGWDVVNEALNDDGTMRPTPWFRIIGEDYLQKAFEYAHEADPAAELYYNDYALEGEAKRRGALALMKKLLAAGVPVKAIGLQTHVRLESPTIKAEADTIEAFAALGLKVNITELDVDTLPRVKGAGPAGGIAAVAAPVAPAMSEAQVQEIQDKLTQRYAQLFAVFVKHRADIARVTFWGVTDDGSWLNDWPVRGRTNYPLLFDRAGLAKPAVAAVVREAGPAR